MTKIYGLDSEQVELHGLHFFSMCSSNISWMYFKCGIRIKESAGMLWIELSDDTEVGLMKKIGEIVSKLHKHQ